MQAGIDQPLARFPAAWQDTLIAAALLEAFDADALAAVIERPVERELAELVAAGLLAETSGTYCLTGSAAEEAKAALDALPAARQRALAARAVQHFAGRLAASAQTTRAGVERAYMRYLERLCELLIQHEPTALGETIANVPLADLHAATHKHLVRYYQGLGEGFRDRFVQAQALFAQVLAEPDLDDFIRARTLNSSAWFALDRGDYELARTRYAESLTIWQRLDQPLRLGMVLLNMGFLYYELQEYSAAEVSVRESITRFQAADTPYYQAMAYNALGLIHRDQGHWEAARALFRQSIESFAQSEAADYRGRVVLNIGELELLCGNLEAAAAWFEQALALMTTRIHAVEIDLNRGLMHQARGDDTAALASYRAALDLAHEIGRRDIVPTLYRRLAHAAQRLGRATEARVSYAAAIAAVETTREPVRDEGLLISLMGRWQEVYAQALLFALEQDDAAAAFACAEQSRARAFAAMLARRGADLAETAALPVTAAQVQASLPPGTLLLAYFTTGVRGPEKALLDAMPPEAAVVRACLETPARLVLLALTRDAIRAHVCALDPNVLHSASTFLADGQRFLRAPVLRRACDALIDPVADLVAAAEHVIVAPHGPLHQLSFAALLDVQQRPLLDRVPRLSYTPSATVLLRSPPGVAAAAQQPCLALGYDGGAGSSLRHTEAEATAIARLCEGVAWRGETGVCQRLLREGLSYRWLHLACHGEFDLNEPLNSWLELGPGERLRATDVIAHLRLAADLVTLSACRSGVSRILRGDEPMGLVRAFLGAGARAVLVTLWPVEDTSARLLMERFYRELLVQGEPSDPAAALRVAQRYLRELTAAEIRDRLPDWEGVQGVGEEGNARPYAAAEFWAAYVLVGGTVPRSSAT